MSINSFIDTVGNVIKISFAIFVISFVILLLDPPPARDPGPPHDYKTPCAQNMLYIQKRLCRDANSVSAATYECGIFPAGPGFESKGGANDASICPLSRENEYYFLFFTDEYSGKKRKRYDMFCPTHGFLSLIVKNSETVPDSKDEEFFRTVHKQKFAIDSIEFAFSEICASRKITPPKIAFRDETQLYKKHHSKTTGESIFSISPDTILFYSVSVFVISGILEAFLMAGRGIWRFFKPEK